MARCSAPVGKLPLGQVTLEIVRHRASACGQVVANRRMNGCNTALSNLTEESPYKMGWGGCAAAGDTVDPHGVGAPADPVLPGSGYNDKVMMHNQKSNLGRSPLRNLADRTRLFVTIVPSAPVEGFGSRSLP